MPNLIRDVLKGDSVKARSLRSSGLIVFGFGASNVLRLASNLILTRLLFPEAFGLMALVYVFMNGLQMFSDLGINLSIIQNKRGEEPAFLNTAWTVQVVRGGILWVAMCLIAYPAAMLYNEPRLAQLLPVVGLSAIILGFGTTKVCTANRNLRIGVQTVTDLGSQMTGLIFTAICAYFWRDVWALVLGGMFASLVKVWAQHRMLPGPANRFCWEPEARREIIRFGKFIFLASIAGFIVNQSDRAVLAGFISLHDLGIYSVGFMLAQVPLNLARAISSKVIFPLYRRFPPNESAANRAKVLRAQRLSIATTISLSCIAAIGGVWIVDFLYDTRYALAGPILVLMCFSFVVQITVSMYDGSYLTHGNSRAHFQLIAIGAVLQLVFLLVGVSQFGMLGAIFSPGLTALFLHFFRIPLVRRYNAWDPVADALGLAVGIGGTLIGCWLWWDQVGPFLASYI